MATAADFGAGALGSVKLPDRYHVARRIASGGMATVWCAEDQVLDRSVAIKVLSEAYAHDPAATVRFKREARAAARLSSHDHVVTIYDVGECPQHDDVGARPFIVMEYLAGGTVADALRLGEVKRAEAVRWLHEAAEALDFAHARGVIHRDIKPANFMLDRTRVLHVADFGIARLGTEDAITKSGDMLGTAAYLAPERAQGKPASESSDRYALAVAAFELLVGERPFTASHFAAQARQHIEEPPPDASLRNPALPPALDAVLARGMAKRPEDRFASAGEFADAVERALSGKAGRTARAVPPAAWTAPAKSGPAKPPRRSLALAALLAAVVAVVIAALATQGGGSSHPRASASSTSRHAAHARTVQQHSSTATTTAVSSAAASSPAPPSGAASSATPPSATAPSTVSPGSSPSGASATGLEAQGHQLILAGNYQAAIPVLRQAVAAASPGSLTYAYALYDLGHSLRLAGDPRAAIPILEKRLQINNQTAVVRAELQRALQAAGQH